MKTISIKRNPGYGSWTVVFTHDGVEYTVVVELKNDHLQIVEQSAQVPSFALDLIRDDLSYQGELSKGFFDESFCRITEANW